MNSLDLMAEWRVAPTLLKRQRRALEEMGITRENVHRAGGLGWARVSTAGRLYTPAASGQIAISQPVWWGPAPSIFEAVDSPRLADLIAWRAEEPARWWYRLGTRQAVLGSHNLDLAHSENWPISFAMTPLDWLCGDCRGAVLLEICEAHFRALDEAEAAAATEGQFGGEAA